MYLKRLEIQGFKTFAQKTMLEFMPDRHGRRGITAVVGPNGSGKSNIADALRWVMGEQSLKLLRGKKSEDVIFSGSDKRARSGFAEVTLILENDDPKAGSELTFSEVAITRRLYRDGQSEYEVNRQAARLQDVVLLLAQCGIGQRTYSVIGQGMVDHVLVASPAERKEFFDEAFGLRPFQLKKNSAINKLEEAKKNLGQTEALLREIGPRLVTLERQVKRLQERDQIEKELRVLERGYYGWHWKEISEAIQSWQAKLTKAKTDQSVKEQEARALESELTTLEKATPPSEGFRELRQALDRLAEERAVLRERQMKLETKRAVAEARAEKPWAPLPLTKIIESIDALRSKHEELETLLAMDKPDVSALKKLAKDLRQASAELVGKLQKPAPEPPPLDLPLRKGEIDEVADITRQLAEVAEKTVEAQSKLEEWNKNEEKKRSHIFELQHKLNAKRQEMQTMDHQVSAAQIELARVETRRETFLSDLRAQSPMLEKELDGLIDELKATNYQLQATDASRLQRLRSQMEWIGGIDPETIKEHKETKERFEFLSKQVDDLKAGMNALELVIRELDQTIKERGMTAFKTLDREFGIFFKKLFNGGEAKLLEIQPEPEVDEEGNVLESGEPGSGSAGEAIAGIEIQATPPGKRFKSIALLSGGERALTSIALIGAIMATNPSPFVVLDEVDAALDESNSRKFAEIIHSLADKTQFIVVTHNRATMTFAGVLYGVTMGQDGVSQLLSVKLEDVEKIRQKQTA